MTDQVFLIVANVNDAGTPKKIYRKMTAIGDHPPSKVTLETMATSFLRQRGYRDIVLVDIVDKTPPSE